MQRDVQEALRQGHARPTIAWPLRVVAKAVATYGRFCRRQPLGGITAIALVLISLVAIFANFIAPQDPLLATPALRNKPPSAERWFGADLQGRDVLSRVIHGSRLSLLVGVCAVLIGSTFGAFWGLASGYLSGKLDLITQRLIEVWMSFPTLIMALILMVVMKPGLLPVVIAVAFTRVPYSCRVIRSVSLAARSFTYVDAARAIGASDLRIMFRHVLPNCVAPFLILASAHIGLAIILEATLGFLGVGIPPPTPSWGNMLSSSVLVSIQPSWWLVVYPGLAIVITVLSFNLFGDALRDVLDPRLRGAR